MYTNHHETSEALNQNNSSYCLYTHSNGGGLLSSFLLFPTINPTNASSISSDLEVTINSVLELSLTTCNSPDSSQVVVNITPSSTGSFKSNCQTATVHTNMPGYTLSAKSTGSNPNYQSGATTNSLLYLNPTTITPTPTIPSTTSPISTPTTLTNDTWGFAVEALNSTDTPSNQASTTFNFDSSYAIDNASNTYAELPTSDTTIYQTDQFPITVTDHTFYYAARLTPDTVAGSYATTITYTAVGEAIPDPVYYLTDIVRQARVTTMQQLTSTLCTNATYDTTNGGINDNNTVILTDIRNNQDYRVRKMPDDRCWMIDNLKIADITLTPEDTNITEDYYLVPIGTRGTAVDTPYVDDPAINSPDKEYCINNTAREDKAFTESYSPDSQTGCGYLYSWSAATAGTGNGLSIAGQNATNSICPVNWRLPTGASRGEFAVLNGSMLNGVLSSASSENTEDSRNNWFPRGLFSGSIAGWFRTSWIDQGARGNYWSATALSDIDAYRVYIYEDDLRVAQTGTYKYSGFAVRCIL